MITSTAQDICIRHPDRFFIDGEWGRDGLPPFLEAKTAILDEEP
jgi:hypothetical protein